MDARAGDSVKMQCCGCPVHVCPAPSLNMVVYLVYLNQNEVKTSLEESHPQTIPNMAPTWPQLSAYIWLNTTTERDHFLTLLPGPGCL